MTCIAAIAQDGFVWMGSDSCGSNNRLNIVRADPKVFIKGEFIIGYTSSFRMGQLLQHCFNPPKQYMDQSDHEFMVTKFIDAVRETFKNGGYAKISNGEESGGTFLVGYKGVLYEIDDDFQVGIPAAQYAAIGSGDTVALGSLYTSVGAEPEKRIHKALEASEFLTPYVRSPFVILKK